MSPFIKAARRNGGSAETQAARNERASLLVRDGILVRRDINSVKTVLEFLTGQFKPGEVNKHEVVVRTAGNKLDIAGKAGLSQAPERSLRRDGHTP